MHFTFSKLEIIVVVILIAIAIFIPYVLSLLIVFILLHDWFSTTTFFKPQRHYNYRKVDETIDSDAVLFRFIKYKYLKSQQWQNKRQLVFKRDNYKCQLCSSISSLVVHHISYAQMPNEPISSLVTLCKSCHTKVHEKRGYPQSYEDYTTKYYRI